MTDAQTVRNSERSCPTHVNGGPRSWKTGITVGEVTYGGTT